MAVAAAVADGALQLSEDKEATAQGVEDQVFSLFWKQPQVVLEEELVELEMVMPSAELVAGERLLVERFL